MLNVCGSNLLDDDLGMRGERCDLHGSVIHISVLK